MQSTTNGKKHIAQNTRAPLDRAFNRDVAEDRTLSHGAPAKPLLGALPLTRLIPQDVHSVMDYANGAATGAGALLTDDPAARIASIALGASIVGVSALTDYRLSLANVIPIKGHETADYLWGAAAIAAPFALGYWKRAPHVAMMHVMAGAGTILSSLMTDYRSAKRRR
jgi:hypothetical protein